MNFLIPLDYFHIENVQFLKIKKNIVMENSLFIKMIYTDENIVMNGIYLDVPLLSVNNEGVQNTSFFFFNVSRLCTNKSPTSSAFIGDKSNCCHAVEKCEGENRETEIGRVLTKLIEMENDILQYYQFITPVNYKKKTPVFSLKSQIEKGYIKWGFTKSSFPKTLQHICLKISGVWENDQEYGINYKFLPY